MKKFNFKTVIYIALCAIFTSSCDAPQYEEAQVCHKLISKKEEQVCITNAGQFETVYYFLYDNDELREVPLKEYMKYEVGQTLCWTETYRVK